MYSFKSTVRFSQCDTEGKLSCLALIDYLQDCAVFHSHAVGGGPEVLRQRGLAWFILTWQIHIHKLPKLYDEIIITTWPHDMKSLMAPRNFTITSPSGHIYVEADSLWCMFDFESERPIRLPDDVAASYVPDTADALSLPRTKRNIAIQGEGKAGNTITVEAHHLDSNMHVNNAQYVDMAKDTAQISSFSTIWVQYKKPAGLKDEVVPVIYCEDDKTTVSLNDEQGQAYAIVQMIA